MALRPGHLGSWQHVAREEMGARASFLEVRVGVERPTEPHSVFLPTCSGCVCERPLGSWHQPQRLCVAGLSRVEAHTQLPSRSGRRSSPKVEADQGRR